MNVSKLKVLAWRIEETIDALFLCFWQVDNTEDLKESTF